jgi:flagellar motor switch protein FliN/FliY
VPESSGVLPSWYGEGDSSSISRLKTLAQELGKLLLPEDLEVPSVSVGRVESLSEGLNRGQIAEDATTVAIPLVRGEAISAAVTLLWPVAAPEELLAGSANRAEAHTSDPSELDPNQPDSSATDPSMAQDGALEGAASKPREGAVSPPPRQRNVEGLPGFAQSLLKIRVPLEVVLARKNQSVREILELGQGTIIQFSKSCDELLDLEVDGHRIATGEVVKVGDKFGIRIVQMVLPDERFGPVRKSAS